MSQTIYKIIEGLVMDWTAYDSLNVRCQSWKLKCENFLESEVVSLSDAGKH